MAAPPAPDPNIDQERLCRAFRLERHPFAHDPDPHFFYATAELRQAHGVLLKAMLEAPGLFLVTGEAGVGKTIFLMRLEAELRAEGGWVLPCRRPGQAAKDLFARLALSPEDGDCDPGAWAERVADALAARVTEPVVLSLDGAERISGAVLDRLQMLIRLRIRGTAGLRILLCGRNGIEQSLKLPAFAGLAAHLVHHCRLTPLGEGEIGALVRHRLQRAGSPQADLFTEEAVVALARHAQGMPRRVNWLCDRALHLAHDSGVERISARILERAAHGMVRCDMRIAESKRRAAAPGAPSGRSDLRLSGRARIAAGLTVVSLAGAFTIIVHDPTPTTRFVGESSRRVVAMVDRALQQSMAVVPGKASVVGLDARALEGRTAAADAVTATGQETIGRRAGALPSDREAPVLGERAAPAAGPDGTPRAANLDPGSFDGRQSASNAALSPAAVETSLARGDALLAIGDISGARRYYEHAADAGSRRAAIQAGKTYDPRFLRAIGARGMAGAPQKAAAWYRKAAELEDAEAAVRAGKPGSSGAQPTDPSVTGLEPVRSAFSTRKREEAMRQGTSPSP